MKHSEVAPFVGKRVTVRLESGLYEWDTLLYWDGAEVADRRLFLENTYPNGIWSVPTIFPASAIVPDGIRVFPA